MHNNSWCWRDFFPSFIHFRNDRKIEMLTWGMKMNQFNRIFTWFAIGGKRKIGNIQWKVFFNRFFCASFQATMMMKIKKFSWNDENISIQEQKNVAETFWRIGWNETNSIGWIFHEKTFPLPREETSIMMRRKRDEIACAWNLNNYFASSSRYIFTRSLTSGWLSTKN